MFLVEQHSLPMVSANIIMLSGSDRNPPDQPGLASFTAEMLDEGTGKRSPLQIAADADQIGASALHGIIDGLFLCRGAHTEKKCRCGF